MAQPGVSRPVETVGTPSISERAAARDGTDDQGMGAQTGILLSHLALEADQGRQHEGEPQLTRLDPSLPGRGR